MYESKTEPGRKFGSAFRGKRFDSYHDEAQPKVEATPVHHGEEKDEKTVTGGSHSPVVDFHIVHDHEGKKHSVTSTREDGSSSATEHGSAKEAHDSAEQLALEAGGTEQASDVKKREHPDQQGAESEERGYEMPDLV
jgi:hypothetical protein